MIFQFRSISAKIMRMPNLLEQATKNVRDILSHAIQLAPTEQALIVYDLDSPLSRVLTEAYRAALPTGKFLLFSETPPEQILAAMRACKPGDLVVLVQSSNFRLNEFRIRMELFKLGLKTIEHTHVNRLPPDQEEIYIQSLTYDQKRFRDLGHSLKEKLDRCSKALVRCAGTEIHYETGMEPSKLNVGDYTGMKNIGGTFPIGEVFTEPKDLSKVNGTAMIFAYAPDDHLVRTCEPFPLKIVNGEVVSYDGAPEGFAATMSAVRATEPLHVREFGLGLNPAMNRRRIVNDITAFERMTGLHFSIGAKHPIYLKPGLPRKGGRFHIDVFIDAQEIYLDDTLIFKNEDFVV